MITAKTRVYLALGANLGDREANIRRAIALLGAQMAINAMSCLYETDPIGYIDQPMFLNATCEGATALAPIELLAFCKRIEAQMGRQGTFRNAPRPIDIDILLYGDLVLETPTLTIPHPGMAERAFVLAPLAEIAPDALHPVLHKTVREILTGVSVEGVRRQAAEKPSMPVRRSGSAKKLSATRSTSSGQAPSGADLRANRAAKHWLEIAVTVPPELVEPLTELFAKRGKASVAIEELSEEDQPQATLPKAPASDASPAAWAGPSGASTITLRAYLPGGVAGRRGLARIDAGMAILKLIAPLPPLRIREVDAEEWESALRGHFTALHAGKRLVVCPAWEDYAAKTGEIVVLLDPGASFGTGHHPTTRLCLELLEERVRAGVRVLDVGTGSGILAIAAAKLGAVAVMGVDTDPLSVRMARRNARANGAGKQIRVAGGSIPLPDGAEYGLVVANITAPVLEAIMPHLRNAVEPGGLLLLSGILEPQLPSLLAKADAYGFTLEEQRQEEDWVALALRSRPTAG